ncbi:MAG TPA: ergothioneine biosynthesis protein EgtB, partial [Alphaproteobacteria bacterium]|nr:ergothioneine biosynthesis protein EgtB [Alphaproteobacteria bacterium]
MTEHSVRALRTPNEVTDLYQSVRRQTGALTEALLPEDMMLQSMEDASPAKWHLAHTSWFFEEFILRRFEADYSSPDDRFAFLFNSYYVQAGPRHARDKRGLISRPGIAAVRDYRDHIDDAVMQLLAQPHGDQEEIHNLITLGCHHEMQHQE